MPPEDISYDRPEGRFTYRVAGVALENDQVLLEWEQDRDICYLPGGRGTLLEPAPDALMREMREELGVDVEIGRLLWVIENFFTRGPRHHEIGFYFLMRLPKANPVSEGTPFAVPDTPGHVFEWHPLRALAVAPFHPTLLRSGLLALPSTPTYLVHQDPGKR